MNFSQSAIFSILASFGLLLINLFISIIEARVLGPEEIGRFQVYMTTQTYVATICALGIGQSCIYFINALNENEREVLATSIKASMLLSLVAGIGFLTVILLCRNYFGYDSLYGVILFCLGTSFTILNNIFTPVLLAKMEVVKNQLVKYSTRLLTLMILLFVVLQDGNLSVGFLIGLTGITSIVSTCMLYYYFHNRFSFVDGVNFSLLGRITTYGLRLSGNNIASITLTSIPIYFLTWFSLDDGMLNVGYYGRANTLLVVGTVISSAIGPLLYSKWSGVSGNQLKEQVRRVSMPYFITNVIIVFGLVVTAPFLINLLYGPEFNSSILTLQILSVSLIANGIKEICYGILSSQGYPTRIFKNLLWGILISGIGNYFMISRYALIGCACVTSIVSFVTAFMLMVDTTKVSQIKLSDYFIVPSKTDMYYIISQVFSRL